MQVLNNYFINGSSPVTVSGVGITAKYFAAPTSNFTTGAGSTPNSTSSANSLIVPGSNKLNGQPFRVYASGNVTNSGTPSPTITIDLVATLLSTVSWVVLASTGVVSQGTGGDGSFPWSIDATLQGDSTSGILQGYYFAMFDGTLEASTPKATNNVLSGVSFGPTSSVPNNESGLGGVCGLAVRVTFGTSAAGNTASMYTFRIES